jgi:hypothetical protein
LISHWHEAIEDTERKNMAVIAKFKVDEIKISRGQRVKLDVNGLPQKDLSGRDVYEDCEMRSITMFPVYGNGDPHHPNTKFWQASPSGKIELGIVNPAAGDQFSVGQEWLIEMRQD